MRILIVDDDALVMRGFTRMLRGYTVTATTDARDALAMIQKGEMFDAILCDLKMPNMTGRDFYAALQTFSPELAARVVFTTGGLCNAEDAAFAETQPVLMKPFSRNELSVALMPLSRSSCPLSA